MEDVDTQQRELQRKIKNCSVCKIQKMNHIVREYSNTNNNTSNSNNTSGMNVILEAPPA